MQLIMRSQKGDQEAFAELFEQYKNLVYKTAYLMLGEADDAQEALQEVFVNVHRSLPAYDPRKAAFTTWLYRITIRYCLNHRRKRRISSQSLEESHLKLQADSSEMDFAEKDEIQKAISLLNKSQIAVIILRYYNDLSYAEIAQILDIPLGTVKSRLDRSLKVLRQILSERRLPSSSLTTEVNP